MKIRGLLLYPDLVVSALLSVAVQCFGAVNQPESAERLVAGITVRRDADTERPIRLRLAQRSRRDGIAIIKQGPSSDSLVRILPTGGGTWGLAITPDGRYLLDRLSLLVTSQSRRHARFVAS